ncbi:NAD(P)H-binding protein [Actinocatenispora sera]|uniref:NAD-dependent epimerase/dehydratase family protein n=1 Tax=Actinocatenispora sera TaxID=390989 RepID=UPI0033CA6795
MRIFLAGGSGVIGSRLVPELVAAGHEVTATTRHADRFDRLRGLGATPVQVDVYDAARLTAVVAEAAPELVMHELTDLSDFDTDANARLRREGTANLVAAALAAGVQRMTVQSITWAYRDGDAPAVEDDPLQPDSAIETMEDLVCRLPRLDWPDGAYHLVDDEPAPATEWLPVYADRLGAPAPAVADVPVGTPRGRGASNAKARATGWTPIHPTWRTGFRHR